VVAGSQAARRKIAIPNLVNVLARRMPLDGGRQLPYPRLWNSSSHGARPVHLIITMIKWIWTSRLSIKNSLCTQGAPGWPTETAIPPTIRHLARPASSLSPSWYHETPFVISFSGFCVPGFGVRVDGYHGDSSRTPKPGTQNPDTENEIRNSEGPSVARQPGTRNANCGVRIPELATLEQFLESVESLHRVQTKSEPLNHRECSLLTTYWSESTVSS